MKTLIIIISILLSSLLCAAKPTFANPPKSYPHLNKSILLDKVTFCFVSKTKAGAIDGAFGLLRKTSNQRVNLNMEVFSWENNDDNELYFVAILHADVTMGLVKDRKMVESDINK